MDEVRKYTSEGFTKTEFEGVPGFRDSLKEAKNHPKHKSDTTHAKAGAGLGVTGMLGCAGAEALEIVGENVAEIVGGGTGVGIVLFFLFKFFSIEMEEISGDIEESSE